jgi:hypothetical protein
MIAWLKKYWPALIASALLLAVLDGTISSLMTCHPITNASDHAAEAKKAEEECTAFHGPILVTIEWFAHLAHKYEGLITVVTTIFLVIFTGRLWWSTDKLWKAATDAAQAQSDETKILQRAYLSVKALGVEPYKNSPDKIDAKIAVENVGKLPAREVSWVVCRKLSCKPELTWFPINEKRLEGKNVIAPGAVALKSCRNISASRIIKFKKGIGDRNRYLYVWGLIRYTDGFGNPRFTYFCHRYNMAAEVDLRISSTDARQHEYGKNDAN